MSPKIAIYKKLNIAQGSINLLSLFTNKFLNDKKLAPLFLYWNPNMYPDIKTNDSSMQEYDNQSNKQYSRFD